MDIAHLLFYLEKGKEVDVARIISNELKMVAESGHKVGA